MKVNQEKHLPQYFTIDISPVCNLHCLYCSQGQGLNLQPKDFMSLEEFKEISTDILKTARAISLANWSEPFLHPELGAIVRYIKQKSPAIYMSFSSNGNRIEESTISQLIGTSLNRLEITISGLDQETYARYHKGGQLDRVICSLTAIAKAKQKKASQVPAVCINYLVFPYNVVSVRQIRRWLAQAMGNRSLVDMIDQIRLIRGTVLGHWQEETKILAQFRELWGTKLVRVAFRPRCRHVFNHLAIRADGTVFPCCIIQYDDRYSLGNLREESLKAIWDKSRWFRDGFKDGSNRLCRECYFLHGFLPLSSAASIGLNLRLLFLVMLQIFYQADHTLLREKIFRKFWIRFLKGF